MKVVWFKRKRVPSFKWKAVTLKGGINYQLMQDLKYTEDYLYNLKIKILDLLRRLGNSEYEEG